MSDVVAQGNVQTGGGDGGDQTATSGQGDQGKPAEKPWYSTYPSDLHDSLKGYDKPETLIQEHLTLKKKHAVPEKPEEYEYEAKGLDDTQKKAVETFRTEAQELGLSKDQFKTMVQKALKQNQDFWERRRADEKKAQADKNAEIQKGIDTLKSEWGNKFEANINLAKKTMQSIFPASFGQFLDDTGLGNHPEMVRAMVRLAESVSEDALVRNQTKNKASNRDPVTGEPMLKFKNM